MAFPGFEGALPNGAFVVAASDVALKVALPAPVADSALLADLSRSLGRIAVPCPLTNRLRGTALGRGRGAAEAESAFAMNGRGERGPTGFPAFFLFQ